MADIQAFTQSVSKRSGTISECADVVPGYALRRHAEHDPEGSHQVILGKHLPDFGMHYHYLPQHALKIVPKGKIDRYLVREGDVLFVSRGRRNIAVLVANVPEKTIASSTFYLLRTKDGVDGAYLAWLLNQTPTQHRIARTRTGAGTPIVQRQVFAGITINLPTIDLQRKIATIDACMARERQLQKSLATYTNRLHTLIGQRLIADLRVDC